MVSPEEFFHNKMIKASYLFFSNVINGVVSRKFCSSVLLPSLVQYWYIIPTLLFTYTCFVCAGQSRKLFLTNIPDL